MDYRDYKPLIERYHELDIEDFRHLSAKQDVIQKLMDISYEKKQIKKQTNAIIREYIEVYENSPHLLDAKAEKDLNDFSSILLPPSQQFLDTPIALRISKLLFQYYRSAGDVEQTVLMLERCAVFDIMMKEHLDDYDGSAYPLMAEQYLADFDKLSEKARRALINCWLLSVINRKDMTFGLKKYREIKVQFEQLRQTAGDQFMLPQYISCKTNALAFALESCRRAEYARKYHTTMSEPMIDLEKEAPLIAELRNELQAILDSENAQNLISDHVILQLYCAQASYHLGQLSMEELLRLMERCSRSENAHSAMEQFTALFTANAYYMDYLYKCSNYSPQYILDKSTEIITHVLQEAKKLAHQFGSYQTNYCMLMLVNSASNIVDFDFFKNMVLNATVYANKALYVHTIMVKEICFVILTYILEHDPHYLDGVCGYSWKYCQKHKEELLALMENCALFHDIGKYFCLDYVSNSSRNLTDDEFEIIKAHPANFSKIYQGRQTPQVVCIHDCSMLHHLWYNEQGGYPLKKHTANQPFVNIISIADSIDAATDNIGRPYGQGKTLLQLMDEFDSMKGTRYSGYICDLLHVEEIMQHINYIINEKRKDIYFSIYEHTENSG